MNVPSPSAKSSDCGRQPSGQGGRRRGLALQGRREHRPSGLTSSPGGSPTVVLRFSAWSPCPPIVAPRLYGSSPVSRPRGRASPPGGCVRLPRTDAVGLERPRRQRPRIAASPCPCGDPTRRARRACRGRRRRRARAAPPGRPRCRGRRRAASTDGNSITTVRVDSPFSKVTSGTPRTRNRPPAAVSAGPASWRRPPPCRGRDGPVGR